MMVLVESPAASSALLDAESEEVETELLKNSLAAQNEVPVEGSTDMPA